MNLSSGGPLSRLLILLIGVHSCALGLGLLFLPRRMAGLLGMECGPAIFFPSQAGIFLLILGVVYLLALKEPAYVLVLLLSKAAAMVFLVTHAAFLSGPPILWLAALGDGGMLMALSIALRLERRRPSVPS
ncbi:MAG: hypothetical protein AAB339_01275 [Elusimicrobiota bacterium]